MRLDQHLVQLGLAPSRQRAKELITSGQVYVNGNPISKPSWGVPLGSKLEIKGETLLYPSRAGLKLEEALRVFQINVENLVVLDVGASTGGFTSCLLKHGARKVYAVDVGQDQLAPELRGDQRVVNLEKTNIRDLTLESLGEFVDLVTIDVSFISLRLVFPPVCRLLKPRSQLVALVKPQFETGGKGLNKHGVISDQDVHLKYIPPLIEELQKVGCGLLGFHSSPISGAKGNLEFLAHFQLGQPMQDGTKLVREVIKAAWED
ncbi:MAG: TlyA family RNA methyltransferase [Firmicutes bacterium]|nr:TlyA family RNA methyltransferase [Bacillota bacterium]